MQKTIFRAYKYKIYPTKMQIEFLENHFGACRFVYNYFWGKYKDTKLPNKTTLQKELKKLKKDEKYAWLNQINSQSLQVSIHNLIKAYKRAFSKEVVKERKTAFAKANTPKQKTKALKLGFPKFKSKKDNYQSFNIPQNVKLKDNKVYIPKSKEGIKVKFHRQLPQNGTIKQATISRKNGKYFISILIEEVIKITQKPFRAIGIDMGLEHFIILSNGEKISNPKWFRKTEKRLKILQRRLSKKVLYSKNWYKLKAKISKLHETILNQRNDFLHKASAVIAKQYSLIAIENLSVKNMQKNHYLAKSISDVSWSKFVEFLKYKSEWYGAKLIQIDKFSPSSKTCSICGYKIDKLPLSKRKWTCPYCNTIHDRDINAAKNMLKFVLSGMEQPKGSPQNLFCGVSKEPVEVCQKATVEAGSPDLFALAKS